jgi:hypothetical protein
MILIVLPRRVVVVPVAVVVHVVMAGAAGVSMGAGRSMVVLHAMGGWSVVVVVHVCTAMLLAQAALGVAMVVDVVVRLGLQSGHSKHTPACTEPTIAWSSGHAAASIPQHHPIRMMFCDTLTVPCMPAELS